MNKTTKKLSLPEALARIKELEQETKRLEACWQRAEGRCQIANKEMREVRKERDQLKERNEVLGRVIDCLSQFGKEKAEEAKRTHITIDGAEWNTCELPSGWTRGTTVEKK